jgi:Rrf2 family protein
MVSLARHYGEGPLSIADISRETSIPSAYLEQLIAPLRRASLVSSKRGARGGYMLARTPDDVRIGDIYRVMEGPVAPMDCVSEDPDDQTCPLIDGCETRPIWLKVRDSIIEALDSTTLADLANRRGKPLSDEPAARTSA